MFKFKECPSANLKTYVLCIFIRVNKVVFMSQAWTGKQMAFLSDQQNDFETVIVVFSFVKNMYSMDHVDSSGSSNSD